MFGHPCTCLPLRFSCTKTVLSDSHRTCNTASRVAICLVSPTTHQNLFLAQPPATCIHLDWLPRTTLVCQLCNFVFVLHYGCSDSSCMCRTQTMLPQFFHDDSCLAENKAKSPNICACRTVLNIWILVVRGTHTHSASSSITTSLVFYNVVIHLGILEFSSMQKRRSSSEPVFSNVSNHIPWHHPCCNSPTFPLPHCFPRANPPCFLNLLILSALSALLPIELLPPVSQPLPLTDTGASLTSTFQRQLISPTIVLLTGTIFATMIAFAANPRKHFPVLVLHDERDEINMCPELLVLSARCNPWPRLRQSCRPFWMCNFRRFRKSRPHPFSY